MSTLLYGLFMACIFYTGIQGARAAKTGDRSAFQLCFGGAVLSALSGALMGMV